MKEFLVVVSFLWNYTPKSKLVFAIFNGELSKVFMDTVNDRINKKGFDHVHNELSQLGLA